MKATSKEVAFLNKLYCLEKLKKERLMEYPIFFVLMITVIVIRALYQKEMEKKDVITDLEKQKDEYTKVVKEQKDRELNTPFDEDRFWDMVEVITERSGDSYRNFLGLLKDKIRDMSKEELIMLDNLLIKFYRENLSYELYAASTIIFKSEDLVNCYLLMNVLVTKGRVFFKQACKNPELIIGKSFRDVDGKLINDVLSELYFAKAKELMPIPTDEEWDIPGEKWKFRDLPEKYPELWAEFN